MRLVMWCHVSGLFDPVIPRGLIEACHRFLFTSACSLEAPDMPRIAARTGERLGVVSSGAGFASLSRSRGNPSAKLSVGYVGSLNFSKLHPDYVDFLRAVDTADFKVRMIGETLNRDVLQARCRDAGRPRLLEFAGYVADVAGELRTMDVLAYLLSPVHYGTAENALLEAMAMGVVPIVLDNPAERHIVEHQRTGLVVRSPSEFAEALDWLRANPEKRFEMSARAAAHVREHYTAAAMESSLRAHYQAMIKEERRRVPFEEIFGSTPDEWFLSCRSNRDAFDSDLNTMAANPARFGLMEHSKGSVFHFLQYFPQAERLREWASRMEASQCV